MQITPQIQEAIDTTMDWFDFEKVHKVMVFLGWGWGTDNAVPELPEIKSYARKIMVESIQLTDDQNMGYTVCCGGFLAKFKLYSDDTPLLELKFILEDWDQDVPS
jgi:hypothetical protein